MVKDYQTDHELEVAAAQQAEAKAEVRRARAEFARARGERERRESAPQLYPAEELAAARSREEVAAAVVEAENARESASDARLQALRDEAARLRLRAPISGRVATILVSAGMWVERGSPVVQVIGHGPLLARFTVPPRAAALLSPGKRATFIAGEPPFRSDCVVVSVSPSVDLATQMVFVEVEVCHENSDQLRPGLVGRVELPEC